MRKSILEVEVEILQDAVENYMEALKEMGVNSWETLQRTIKVFKCKILPEAEIEKIHREVFKEIA